MQMKPASYHTHLLHGLIALLAGLTLLFSTTAAHAVSCDPQNGVDIIGSEYIADSCIPDGMSDGATIHWTVRSVICRGGSVIENPDSSSASGWATPSGLIAATLPYNFKVFRNKEGTHLLSVHRYYTGLIDGKSMAPYSFGSVYTDVITRPIWIIPATPVCQGGDFNRPANETCAESSVNVGTGRLSHDQELFSIKGSQPLRLALSLYYRSLQPSPSTIGNGWSHSYETFLTNGAGYTITLWLNGKRRIYNNYSGSYVPPKGDYSTLVQNADSSFTITEKDGLKRNFAATGLATSIIDRNGNTISFSYTSGKLSSITDANGRTALFSYDSDGKLSSITDPKANSYNFSYTGGKLTTVTHPDTGQWNYSYNSNGLLASKTDPESNLTSYSYDSNNRLSIATDPNSRTLSYTHAPTAPAGKVPDSYPIAVVAAKPLTYTAKDGNGWSYSYEALTENILSKTDPLGNNTSYTYDTQGNLLTKTEPGIGTTTYTYDSKGNILTVKDPLNQTTSFTYNSFGQILTVSGAPGSYAYSYDTAGNLLTSTNPANETTSYTYDSKGNLLAITDPRSKVTSLAYHATTNDLLSVTLPATGTPPIAALYQLTHDANGNLLTVTDPLGKITTYTYNSGNQVATVTNPLGKVTSYSYEKNGNLKTITDANNKTTSYSYNYRGQQTNSTNALNAVTTLGYGTPACPTCSGADQLTSITDAKNQKSTWVYDTINRVTSTIDPLNKTTAYSYGATDLPTSRTDANGQTISYTYDALQRLTQTSYPDSSTTTFTYDSRNNILTAVNSAVSYSYTYDAANRIKTVADSRGYSISYDYDLNGNRTKTTLQPGTADQRIVNYAYDNISRLETLTSPAGSFSFGYNINNQRTTLAYPNQIIATYSYDDAGRLTALTHSNPDTTIITSAGYTLDDTGNRTAKSGSTPESYSYDATYRILQAITPKGYETYSYDQVGNRTTGPGPRDTSYSHDAANRMTQGRQYSYSYDNNGNQTAKSINETKGWIQSWDYENQLSRSERSKGAEKRTVTYKYDPFGRRIEKKLQTTNPTTTNPTTTETTSYVNDGDNIILELFTDKNGITTKTFYTHGPHTDEHLALERNGQFYYYHADGLGSITAISDTARTVVERYSYSVFGQPRPTTGFRNSYQFTAREWDKETGLYYNWFRYYDPMEGRFISKDPIGFAGGDVNLFAYVQNNPINWIDPEGLQQRSPYGEITAPSSLSHSVLNSLYTDYRFFVNNPNPNSRVNVFMKYERLALELGTGAGAIKSPL
ncbi:MAG: DUF6531 domain-containing protein, partial [Trichlorobacter sp.]|uniref:RHS repeat-associated core domain-containing protein n=1 Tax=Trichlorobacter sp. TaxID=2911007 RepID=UPI002569D7CE